MKVTTPEINWHGRDPIYSADFQFKTGKLQRLATCGTDKRVTVSLIYAVSFPGAHREYILDLGIKSPRKGIHCC